MKKTLRFILLAGAATFFAACGAPAANTGANNATTNANTNTGESVAEPAPFGQHPGPQLRQMAGGLPRREFDRRSEESAKGRTRSPAQKAQEGRAEEGHQDCG